MSHPRVPLFIVCANPACGCVHKVQKPSIQQKQRYCSRRCANLVHHNPTPEGTRKGGLESGRRRRARALARLAGLTVVQAFRDGYTRGFQSATRQILHKYALTRKEITL